MPAWRSRWCTRCKKQMPPNTIVCIQSTRWYVACITPYVLADCADQSCTYVQRNIAVDHARTDLLLLLDVDFVPCRRLSKLCKTQMWTADVAREAAAGALTVIPAFEVTDSIPSEQHELFAQLDAGSAELFHVSRFPQGHQPTDLGAALFLCTSLLYLAG